MYASSLPSRSLSAQPMCHNIVDGRYHTECGHFFAMDTSRYDCRKSNCLFSREHVHPNGCHSSNCIRLMTQPVKNPIRISPTICSECVSKGRTSGQMIEENTCRI